MPQHDRYDRDDGPMDNIEPEEPREEEEKPHEAGGGLYGLNARQIAFAREYLKDGNATQAAIRAGYSAKTANSIVHRLLSNVGIARVIREQQQALQLKAMITPERVLLELARIAFADPRSYFDASSDGTVTIKSMDELTADQRAAIANVEQKFTKEGMPYLKLTFWSKDKAVELIGKHLAMYTEKVEGNHKHEHSGNVETDFRVAGMTPEQARQYMLDNLRRLAGVEPVSKDGNGSGQARKVT